MNEVRPEQVPESALMLGVGGMGMAPLAIFLAQAGCRVYGIDDALQPSMYELLVSYGVRMEKLETISEVEVVVHSSAVALGNAWLKAACEHGLTVYQRGALLARLAEHYQFAAIAGSHGKTTTTAMLIHQLSQRGIPFSYILGGRFQGDRLPASRFDPASEWLIAEVDESDGTIEQFTPECLALVNVDWDHADFYETSEQMLATFQHLAQRTRSTVVAPIECADLLKGLEPGKAQWVPKVPGDFNQANAALATKTAAIIAGPSDGASLENAPGVFRRQEVLFADEKTCIWTDYAHHPTEVEALLRMVAQRAETPIIVVFQPHRYSRTVVFARAFAEVLDAVADQVFLLPVYSAGEKLIEAGQSEQILAYAQGSWVSTEAEALASQLSSLLAKVKKATLLFVGAGDIDVIARRFAKDWALASTLMAPLSETTVLKLGEPLFKHTTLRVGGPARFWIEPASVDALQSLLRQANRVGLPVVSIGRGSNLIVSDAGFDGLVISLNAPAFRTIEWLDDGRIRAGAGLRLKELCGALAKAGKSGFEFLEGIPGTVGGALRMNAGAMGGWIFDRVESVSWMTSTGEHCLWPKDRFHIAYRHCAELSEAIAVAAIFGESASAETETIRRKMDTYAHKRKEAQPREPSAGCLFKNPEGDYAGKLIDELGLKGTRQGGAEVSTVHGNFIINRNQATSADVIALVHYLRQQIFERRGILLEPEVLLLGQTWEEMLT